MIRHEVIIRFKPAVRRDTIDRMLHEVYDLLVSIPSVDRVRFGVNNAPAYRHALIVVDVPDEDALNRFARHPMHARAVQMVHRLADSTATGSYLVGSERHS